MPPRMKPGKKSTRVAEPAKHSARAELVKPEGNRTGNLPVPHYSRKPLPGIQVYPLDSKGHPQTHLCSGKDFKGPHEIDMQFAGWAKGYNDGTYDVSCKLCGEIGSTRVLITAADVNW